MSKFLTGNYKLPDKPGDDAQQKNRQGEPTVSSITQRFEDSALSKLGGSVCFVLKGNSLLWTGDELEEAG